MLASNQVCQGCGECGASSKLKSGKYAKTNTRLKKQEEWPHTNVMRKYTKRTSFEQLEFDGFVAGETNIILAMNDESEARGRLKLLCRLSHWLCRSKDWGVVKGLYEAIVESIELGEEDWLSDFSHYESMIQPYRGDKEDRRKQKDKTEIYWCKFYQKNNCNEASPHMAQVKPDEAPVPVIHICASCFQKDGKRLEHSENDCVVKKEK